MCSSDLALAGMAAGARMQRYLSAAAYQKTLRYALFLIAFMLVAQGMRYFWR